MADQDPPLEPGEVPPHEREGKLSFAEQEQRDAEIVAARLRGLAFEQIARTYGLTGRRVRQIFTKWREENPPIRLADPLEIVDDLTGQYQGAAEELALISATTRNDNARVGAIRARMEVLAQLVELLKAVGALPNDLGRLQVDIDVRYVAEQILTVLAEEGVDERVTERLMATLTRGQATN